MSDEPVSAEEFAQLQAKMNKAARRVHEMADFLIQANTRQPSKAHLIAAGNVPSFDSWTSSDNGGFLLGITKARSRDATEQAEGKAMLENFSTRYLAEEDVASWSKSTLGTTDATGGWIIPNAIVDDLAKPREFSNVYRNLITVRQGITAASVDLPFRSAAPARATVIAFGQTKENSDLAYNGYSATMYTLARIYDLSRQFVRQSSGAAEQDVLSER